MDVLMKAVLDIVEEHKSKRWFIILILGGYAVALICLVFVPDAGQKGTGIKDLLISGFDVGSSVLAFAIGSKLSK